MKQRSAKFSLTLIAPGLLVAATGVGAGDLATAGLAGAKLGVGIVWAVVFGALMKWVLNEGLARWQMATGTTLLEGWIRRLRLQWVFLVYFVVWGFAVGGALISACGVAGSALIPLADDAKTSKIIWGIVHSLGGVILVYVGGFRLFEKIMAGCIGLMFVTVSYCAVRVIPDVDWSSVTFVNPFALDDQEQTWALALVGGVGGTLTLLSYSYWIREEKREGRDGLRLCRIDLTVGYVMTAFFGASLLLIASTTPEIEGKGSQLIALLGARLGEVGGPSLKYVFLIGAWGAIFSSLLGVWQGVPYLFADFVSETLAGGRRGAGCEQGFSHQRAGRRGRAAKLEHAGTWPYNLCLLYLAIPTMITLWASFQQVQLTYAVLGALFMPLLAATLLIMNNRRAWVAAEFRNRWLTNVFLAVTLAFFVWHGVRAVVSKLSSPVRAPAAATQPAELNG